MSLLKRPRLERKRSNRYSEGYNRAQIRLDGLGSTLELTEALIQVRQAELNYAQTVFNYLMAKASYDLAIGRVPLID